MPFNGFDHIDLRVANLERALAFYDALLPALGLTEVYRSEHGAEYYEPPDSHMPRRFLGIHRDAGHRANGSRIAFTAETPGDVDRIADVARKAGATAIEGPEIPQSGEQYYAVFFEDPTGNRLEVAYRRSRHGAAVHAGEAHEGRDVDTELPDIAGAALGSD